jgi:putative hydrolase of the HAD superfamily
VAPHHRLLLITKGDLRDQERKLAKSGLAAHFERVEIVSEKNEATYAAILRRHGVRAQQFLMVGNSLKSDILPVLALGGAGAFVPYHLTWAHERVDEVPQADGRFFRLKRLGDLLDVVRALEPGA